MVAAVIVWTRERLRELPEDRLASVSSAVTNRLCKWRAFFASWQLGTRGEQDGEVRALRHHRETTILLRAEMTALTGLLIEKGVFTAREFTEAMILEAQMLARDYEQSYPGWSAEDDGMEMKLPEAVETMQRLGFPP
jgi:hypothetical protein